jgi:hypothetical protein
MERPQTESQDSTVFINPGRRSRNGCLPWYDRDSAASDTRLMQLTVDLGGRNAMRVIHRVLPATTVPSPVFIRGSNQGHSINHLHRYVQSIDESSLGSCDITRFSPKKGQSYLARMSDKMVSPCLCSNLPLATKERAFITSVLRCLT